MQNSISDRMQVTRSYHYFFSSRYFNFCRVGYDQELTKIVLQGAKNFDNFWTFYDILGLFIGSKALFSAYYIK